MYKRLFNILAAIAWSIPLLAGDNRWTNHYRSGAYEVISDPKDPSTVYAFNASGLFYSTDRGITWTTPANEGLVGFGDAAISYTDPASFYVASDSGVYRTRDRGEHWTKLGDAAGGFQVVLDPIDAERIFVNARAECSPVFCVSRGYRSTDGGATWAPLLTVEGRPALAMLVTPSNPEWLLGAYGDIMWAFARGDPAGTLSSHVAPVLTQLVVNPLDPQILYAVGTVDILVLSPGFYRSDDAGLSWVRRSDIFEFGTLAVNPSNPRNLAMTSRQHGVWISKDEGVTWALLHGLNDDSVSSVAFSADGQTLYAAGSNGVHQYTFCDDCRPLVPSERPRPNRVSPRTPLPR